MDDMGVDSDQDTDYGEVEDDDDDPIPAVVGEIIECSKDGHVTKETL